MTTPEETTNQPPEPRTFIVYALVTIGIHTEVVATTRQEALTTAAQERAMCTIGDGEQYAFDLSCDGVKLVNDAVTPHPEAPTYRVENWAEREVTAGHARCHTLEFYASKTGGWNWRLIAANGQKLARGSQFMGFHDPAEAYANAVRTVEALSGIQGPLSAVSTYPITQGMDVAVYDMTTCTLVLRVRRTS